MCVDLTGVVALDGVDLFVREIGPDDLARLIATLGHDQVDLLGFSTGGQVGQLFVEAHPELVRRLILASTTAYADVDRYLEGWQDYERRRRIQVAWNGWARSVQAASTHGGPETLSRFCVVSLDRSSSSTVRRTWASPCSSRNGCRSPYPARDSAPSKELGTWPTSTSQRLGRQVSWSSWTDEFFP
jgi:pimeloyl-ACP methyl ester carboxylesterase